MEDQFSLAYFRLRFPDDDACLEEIKRQKFPYGVYCVRCKKITKHYKLQKRAAYSCKLCRKHVYPLSGTLFEKSSTSLRVWFYALYIMTQTRDKLSAKQLQKELEVTYKTAWRMRKHIRLLMEHNDGDLLKEYIPEERKERKWVFFNKLEIKVVHKQEPTNDDEE